MLNFKTFLLYLVPM